MRGGILGLRLEGDFYLLGFGIWIGACIQSGEDWERH